MEIIAKEITKDQLDLDITLDSADIKNLFKQELNKSVRKVKMKGFRPGKTPPGLLKRMYGTEMMVELVNRELMNESEKYLKEHGIETFGNFVFKLSNEDFQFNPDADQSFSGTLSFVRAFDPEQLIDQSVDLFTYYLPEIPQHTLEDYIMQVRNSQGTMEEKETITNDSTLSMSITTIEDTRTNTIEATQKVELIIDEKLRESLLGQKSGYSFDTTAASLSDNDSYINFAILEKLNHSQEENTSEENDDEKNTTIDTENVTVEKIKADKDTPLRVTITKIETVRPAEIDESLFAALDPSGSIKSQEDLEGVIRRSEENNYRPTSNIMFFIEMKDKMINDHPLDVDESFIKQYFTQHARVNQHTLDHHLQDLKDDLSWHRIKSALDAEFGWQVSENEIRRLFALEIQQYFGGQQFPAHLINGVIDSQMKNKQSVEEKEQSLYLAKVSQTMVDQLKVPVVYLPLADYENRVKELNQKLAHSSAHNHDHGHEHHHNDTTDETQYEIVNNTNATGEEE